MEHTQFFNLAEPTEIKNRAYCYEKSPSGNWKKVDGHYLNGLLGAGAVYTSLNDYFNYDQALRNRNLFSEDTHKLIFKPSSTYNRDRETRQYAMGWEVNDSIAEHTGGWLGTNTISIRHLDEPLTIVIFMNRNTLFQSDLVQKTKSLVYEYIEDVEKPDPLVTGD